MNHHHTSGPCHGCCGGHANLASESSGFSRRHFLAGAGAFTVGTVMLSSLNLRAAEPKSWLHRRPRTRRTLTMQPVLVYRIPRRREAGNWREWGSVQTAQAVAEEKSRIEAELRSLAKMADFPLRLLPLVAVQTESEAESLSGGDHDGVIMYAAGGNVRMFEILARPDKWNLMFVRHRSGPVYLWYEIAHNRFLRKTVDEFGQPGMTPHDVVVDSQDELLWRLRALTGLKNTLDKRIIAVGGAGGWGEGGSTAPERARDLWRMEIVDFPYPELGRRIAAARTNSELVEYCRRQADAYLGEAGVRLETRRPFVDQAFLLTEVFKDIMDAAETDAITINSCMGTIMPIAETTACLPLSLLNDEGYLAFCESDFVVIPSGILLQATSGCPVFLNDPTYPHDQMVTLAHCTAPRKMNGQSRDPARILTHFESDYGAAPKVEMQIGHTVTNLIPDFASSRWTGFSGQILENPFLDICRSQIDITIDGSQSRLLEEMKGFHWMTAYGNYLKEIGYALNKVGVPFLNLSDPPYLTPS